MLVEEDMNNMDIQVTKSYIRGKINICSVSENGDVWLRRNMEMKLKKYITVDEEHLRDIVGTMERDGLIVQE